MRREDLSSLIIFKVGQPDYPKISGKINKQLKHKFECPTVRIFTNFEKKSDLTPP